MKTIKDLFKAFLILILIIFLLSFVLGVLFSFGFSSQHFALVRISGEIVSEKSTSLFGNQISADELIETIEELKNNPNVVGILFEINSPGGSVVAGQEIYESMLELKKPKVSYIREVGASGAYYLALASDKIISNPYAITGSIGVVSVVTDLSGLFEKLGINTTTIKSGEMKDIGAEYRKMTEEEKKILSVIVQDIFLDFKSEIEKRRKNLNRATFEQILDARILSGKQAKEIGLVDELGTREVAIKSLASLANVSETLPIVEYGKRETNLLSLLFSAFLPTKTEANLKMQMSP